MLQVRLHYNKCFVRWPKNVLDDLNELVYSSQNCICYGRISLITLGYTTELDIAYFFKVSLKKWFWK